MSRGRFRAGKSEPKRAFGHKPAPARRLARLIAAVSRTRMAALRGQVDTRINRLLANGGTLWLPQISMTGERMFPAG
jgi:hypothetical protein